MLLLLLLVHFHGYFHLLKVPENIEIYKGILQGLRVAQAAVTERWP